MKIPFPFWKYWLIFFALVIAFQGVEFVLGIQWPADEPYWKRIVFVTIQMLLGSAIAWMTMYNGLVERFNRRQDAIDKAAKINLLFKCDFTGDKDEGGRTAGESD